MFTAMTSQRAALRRSDDAVDPSRRIFLWIRLQASAIRYYEKIGLLPKTQRIGGQRRYEPGVLNYLEVIDVAKRAGFRMDEIRHLFHGFGKGTPAFLRWQVLAQRKITEMDDLIGRAKKMKLLLQRADRCKCLDLEECGKAVLARSVKKR